MSTNLVNKYTQALASIMPKGFAWPRDPDSVQMRIVSGLAASFAEFDAATAEIVAQWQPATTVARLAEWEQATGLPDPCLGPDQTVEKRKAALLNRLRGPQLVYENSSPAAPNVIVGLFAAAGYVAEVRYNTPARVGRARVGDRLGQLNGKLYITIQSSISGSIQFARVGIARVGDRLSTVDQAAAEIECYVRRIVPARFQPIITFN